MKIFHKLLAVALLFATLIDFSCCKKSDDPNNENGGNGSNPTTEGVYLGIIGFNESLFQKPISLLNSDSKEAFKSFIDGLAVDKGTGLYYADYTSLKKLNAYPEPPQLKNVALVTFTDGLDNVSTSNSEMDPEGYGSISAYRTALHEKIMNETIHGFNVTAYTIGLRGQDVSDEQEFRTNLNMLASSPNNVFEVTNMNEALQRFSDIADALYSITVTSKVKIEVPGGYDEGQVIRFTFDNVTDGGNSIKYIQGTYKRTSDARLLENITYHGLSEGATSLSSVLQSGAYYWFEFENLTHQNGNPISQSDINRLQLWKKQGSGWQRDAEFEPGTSTEITEDKSSALIMLVLDCTTSLGDDFTKMKTGAKRFVETLSSTNMNGGNSGASYAPEVFTSDVTNITSNSAKCGGNITNDGGASVTSRGICWSTSPNPTVSSNHVASGSGTGTFTCNITGLNQTTTYYVRAYATNSAGTSYGEQKMFTTTVAPPPVGAINGMFSVSISTKVFFSKGNLQYKASTNTWRFADNQYDYIGNANNNVSSSYNGWIDLFSWGTSGWNCGNTYYRPWNVGENDGSLYGPPGNHNLTGNYANSDWGNYNAISNGGNQNNQWRTLTHEEWSYLINTRNTSSGIRYAKAKINNVNGLILLPDNWNNSYCTLYNTNQSGANYSSNVISISTWLNSLEAHGAIFLPAAGWRNESSTVDVGSLGMYWSASYRNNNSAFEVFFLDLSIITDDWDYRGGGHSVRLVQNIE